MLHTFKLGNFKSFGDEQSIAFAELGEGRYALTVLVGANNAGKSSVLTTLRALFNSTKDFKASREDRRPNQAPSLAAEFTAVRPGDAAGARMVATIAESNSAYYAKLTHSGSQDGAVQRAIAENRLPTRFLRLKPIYSRRPWVDNFDASHREGRGNYAYTAEQGFLDQQPGTANNALAQALYALEGDGRKIEFDELVRSILPEMVDWTIDCPVDTDFIHYKTRAGTMHRISLSGDGIVNVFRIAFTLLHLEEGDVLLIDEPELSLHPQAQRRLADALLRLSKTYQIIVATHSPHFVSWEAIAKGARIYRVAQLDNGNTICRTLSDATITAIIGIVDGDIRNRRLYDVLAKEMFFADAMLFPEGPDDVHYIENYLRDKQPLPIFGYGAGGAGNLAHWLQVANDLGIRAAALYDLNKKPDYEAAVARFLEEDRIAAFLLFRDDIRDKRNPNNQQVIVSEGIFSSAGEIHPECKSKFDLLLNSIRVHLAG